MIEFKAALVEYPYFLAIAFNDDGILDIQDMRPLIKQIGKPKLLKSGVPLYDHFIFQYGWNQEHVKASHQALELSSRAMMQLVIKFGRMNFGPVFQVEKCLRLLFEGRNWSNVERWWDHVGRHVMFQTPAAELPCGQTQRISVRMERTRNADFWDGILGNCKVQYIFTKDLSRNMAHQYVRRMGRF